MYNTITQRNYWCWFLLPIVSSRFCLRLDFKCNSIVVRFHNVGFCWASRIAFMFAFHWIRTSVSISACALTLPLNARPWIAVSFIPFWVLFALTTAHSSQGSLSAFKRKSGNVENSRHFPSTNSTDASFMCCRQRRLFHYRSLKWNKLRSDAQPLKDGQPFNISLKSIRSIHIEMSRRISSCNLTLIADPFRSFFNAEIWNCWGEHSDIFTRKSSLWWCARL